MTDEAKFETPEEFLKKQLEREQKERDALAKGRQEQSERQAKVLSDKYDAITARIVASWRETVQKAGEQTGVRFAVLADLSDAPNWQPSSQVQQIVSALGGAGWRAEVVKLTQSQSQFAHSGRHAEPQVGSVRCENTVGWRFDGTPKFGESPFSLGSALIVKWGST